MSIFWKYQHTSCVHTNLNRLICVQFCLCYHRTCSLSAAELAEWLCIGCLLWCLLPMLFFLFFSCFPEWSTCIPTYNVLHLPHAGAQIYPAKTIILIMSHWSWKKKWPRYNLQPNKISNDVNILCIMKLSEIPFQMIKCALSTNRHEGIKFWSV